MGSIHSTLTGSELHIAKTNVSTGTPVGNQSAGVIGEFYWDSTNNILYIAESTGTANWITSTSASDEFIELSDTFSSYAGLGGLHLKVNSGETAITTGQALDTTDSPTFTSLKQGGSTILIGDSTGGDLLVGFGTGDSITTGSGITAVGNNALNAITTGDDNTAVGASALKANLGGSENTAVGAAALFANTSGNFNDAFGSQALVANTTGTNNAAFGNAALQLNTTGSDNVAVGVGALDRNILGRRNTAIGIIAGTNIASATLTGENTLIGYSTGLGITTGVQNTIIGANVIGLSATLSNNIILADGAGVIRIQSDSSGNVTIGGDLSISGENAVTTADALDSLTFILGAGTDSVQAADASATTANISASSDFQMISITAAVNGHNAYRLFNNLGVTKAEFFYEDNLDTAGFFSAVDFSFSTNADLIFSSQTAMDFKSSAGDFSFTTSTDSVTGFQIFDTSGGTSVFNVDTLNERIGTGTDAPAAKIHSLATTEQLRLGFDVTNYAAFTVSSGGDLTIAPTGGNLNITGTIASGVWNGTTIAVANGGTGVTTSTGTVAVVLSTQPTLNLPTFVGTTTGPSGKWNAFGMDLASGDSFLIDGTTVLNSTTLGSSVVNSSLTSVGTLSSLAITGNLTVGGTINNATLDDDATLFNLLVGTSAGVSITTGTNNTLVGHQAALSTTTGGSNATLGHQSLFSNTTGDDNVAIGSSALFTNSLGRRNTVVGSFAGSNILSATLTGENTIIGYSTGAGITTGVQNTILGANVTGLSTTLSNNVILADGGGNIRLQFDNSGDGTIGGALNVTGAGVFGGDLTISTDGSSTVTPRMLGFTDYSAGEAAKFRFGDDANVLQNAFGNAMDLYSFHTLRLLGDRSTTTALSFSTESNIGVHVIGTTIASPVLVVSGASGQTGDLFQVRNNSGTVLALFDASGDLSVTGAYIDSLGSPGTSGQFLSSTVTGTDWIDSTGNVTTSATLTDNFLVRGNGTEDIDIGSISMDSGGTRLRAGAGTELLPTYSFTSNTNRGMYDSGTSLKLVNAGFDVLELLSETFSTHWLTIKATDEVSGGAEINIGIGGTSTDADLRINALGTGIVTISSAGGASIGSGHLLVDSGGAVSIGSGASTFDVTDGETARVRATSASFTKTSLAVVAPSSISQKILIGINNTGVNNGDAFITTVGTTELVFSTSAGEAIGISSLNVTMTGDLTVDTNTLFVDSTNNRVGIRTVSPQSPLHVVGASTNVGGTIADFRNSADSERLAIIDENSTSSIPGGFKSVTGFGLGFFAANGTKIIFYTGGVASSNEVMRVDGGNFGVGISSSISAKVHVLETTEQLRLGYDATNYASFTVSSTGDLTIAPTGGDTIISGTINNATLDDDATLFNLLLGASAGSSITTSTQNTAIGHQALASVITAAVDGDNTAVGYKTLFVNTADGNTAIGSQVLMDNTTGSLNVGIGLFALFANTTGDSNTALGTESLGTNLTGEENTAIGAGALASNILGRRNTTLGKDSGRDVLSAIITGENTLIGYNTGRGITTGVQNTILGANVTGLTTTLSNNIILADGAGVIRLQYDSAGDLTTGGNVTIGGNISSVGTINSGAITGDSVSINGTGGLFFNSAKLLINHDGSNANITNSTGNLSISSTTGIGLLATSGDTVAVLGLTTSNTNSGTMDIFVGDQNPDGTITGAGGDIYIKDSGALSNLFFNKEATTGTDWQGISLISNEVHEIFSTAEYQDLGTASVITTSSGTNALDFKTLVISATRHSITARAAELMLIDRTESNGIAYTGSTAYITSLVGGDVTMKDVTIVAGIPGTPLFDYVGDGTLSEVDVVSFHGTTALVGWDLGSISRVSTTEKGPIVTFKDGSILLDSTASLILDSVSIFGLNSTFIDQSDQTGFGGPIISIKDSAYQGGRATLFTLTGNLYSSETLVRIDPGLPDDYRVNVFNTNLVLNGTAVIFDTSGSTGTFTAVSDASISATTITGVTDSSGIASFTHAIVSPTLTEGALVVVSGFTINTDYNTTGIVTAATATTFEIDYVAFGTTETGSFLLNAVAISSTAHGLSDGDGVTLDTTLSTAYDGGFLIWDSVPNSFQVPGIFSGTKAGTWSTEGLDQTDPRVLANNNPGTINSQVLAFGFTNNNTATTTITDGTYAAISAATFDENGVTERFKLTDSTAVIFTLTALESFEGFLRGGLTAVKSGSTSNYRFAMSTNGAVPVFASANYVPMEVKTTAVNIALAFSVNLDVGDTIQIMVAGDGTSDVLTITDLVFGIS